MYLGAGGILMRRLLARVPQQQDSRDIILWLTAGGAVLHVFVLYSSLWSNGALNLGLISAASLTACAIVILFLIGCLSKPITSLGVLILPLAALSLAAAWLWPGDQVPAPRLTPLMMLHLVIAFLAYSLLSMAVVQALLILWQERQLRHKHPGRLLRAMPSLQTMEQLLFQMMTLGFVLLTLTLVSGTLFSEELFGKAFVFTHHIVLSLLAWCVFAIILVGHWQFGWRGRTILRWILGGFALLILAYFGSKFVFEIVLHRQA
jgi:ABC-type uncharacterized transport system permease subunit